MSLRNTLTRLMRVVIEEAERNPDFEAALNDALGSTPSKRKPSKAEALGQVEDGEAKRGKNRRAPAALDPVQIVRDGEPTLRSALEKLPLEQLRDIVAEYGMDPGRLVMKWNTPERVIDRIVEMSVARAHKGNAFRKPADNSHQPNPEEPGDPAVAPGETPSNIPPENKLPDDSQSPNPEEPGGPAAAQSETPSNISSEGAPPLNS